MTKQIVELALKSNANSTTCVVIYQPKVPSALNRYKNKNDNKSS